METLITVGVAIIMVAVTTGMAWKDGYERAKREFKNDDALNCYYDGINAGYVRGYNDGARLLERKGSR